jgi:NADPH-dependent 2,4-dienoyl-CoA reductase/sulfur reductase-like enzyme
MIRRELVIVGAGPAGMAAAITAGRCGIRVTIIDENPATGGQIYRQAPRPLATSRVPEHDESAARGDELHKKLEDLGDRIELLSKTTAWGYFPQRQLAIRNQQGWQIIEAEQVILAPGAYEFVPPFPGWTLPGVMTPGAAQSMVKLMKILPGKRALVAGSGPFLLVVAGQLHAAGVEVVGVVEAARRRDILRHIPGLLSNRKLLAQGRQYYRTLQRAGIPFHWGHLVTKADGNESVEQATITPCNAQSRPQGQGTTIPVDTLCVGYGFVPRTDLAQMADCRMRYSELLGGWLPEVDENFETSVPGVRVAGDGGGVAGAIVAELEGELAALAALHQLGRLDSSAFEKQRSPTATRLAKMRKFRATLDQFYRLRPGLIDLALPDTIICRCEELTRHEVETGIQFGGTDMPTLKVITRLGMGPCQAKMCWPMVARMIAANQGKSVADIGPVRVRPPVGPLEMADLLNPLLMETLVETP